MLVFNSHRQFEKLKEDGRYEKMQAGNPIPPSKFNALFNPMYRRPDRGIASRPGSVGLGPYIVREIVSAHEGSVEMKSSLEAGTDFSVHLPRHPAILA